MLSRTFQRRFQNFPEGALSESAAALLLVGCAIMMSSGAE
jgi:hypothetical protein